ncbi:MAG: hypothetical protein AAF616_03625 [Bacteroidota bacterium]
MNLTQIQQINERFQKQAVQLSELVPSGTWVQATSMLMRSSRQIHSDLHRLLSAKSELTFNQVMERMEEEMDEVIFILDQLEIANKAAKIILVQDFLKEGYGLMSIYSKCCDQIISQRSLKEE